MTNTQAAGEDKAPAHVDDVEIFASGINTAILVVFLLLVENRRWNRKYGKPETNAAILMTGTADNAPDYRYIL